MVWSLSSPVCWAVVSCRSRLLPLVSWWVSLLLSGQDRYRRFPLRCGVQRAGGLMCLFLLSSLCTCWLRLCLGEVASMVYQSLTWMLAPSFSLSSIGNCSVSSCALSLISFYCRSSVKLECREASELSIWFSDTAAAKISESLWWSIGSRFSCGPLLLDRSIPVPLFRLLDHDMVASVFFFSLVGLLTCRLLLRLSLVPLF